MALSSFLFGKSPTSQQLPLFTPEQQTLLNTLRQQAQSQVGQPRKSVAELFAPIRQQAQQQYQERGIPGLLNQFTQGGGFGSGHLASALAKGQSDLESQLAAQEAQATLGREGLEQQQLSQLLGLSLQPQFQTLYQPGTTGALGGAASSLGSLLPLLLGNSLGGLGSIGGYSLNRLFGGGL